MATFLQCRPDKILVPTEAKIAETDLHRISVRPGLTPGRDLPQNNAEREDVRLFVEGLGPQHLGRHPLFKGV